MKMFRRVTKSLSFRSQPLSTAEVVKTICTNDLEYPASSYVEKILQATEGTPAQLKDVCAALAPNLISPRRKVVFKALVILHRMIQDGPTQPLLTYLGGNDMLHARSIDPATLTGFPETNVPHYANYLHLRAQAFNHPEFLLHKRNTTSSKSAPAFMRCQIEMLLPSTGLFRALAIVLQLQKQLLTTLLGYSAFLTRGDFRNDLLVSSLKMSFSDLLGLYSLIDSGMMILLSEFYDVELPDAKQAFKIYKEFCVQTKQVFDFIELVQNYQYSLATLIPSGIYRHVDVAREHELSQYITSTMSRTAVGRPTGSMYTGGSTTFEPRLLSAFPFLPSNPSRLSVVDTVVTDSTQSPVGSGEKKIPAIDTFPRHGITRPRSVLHTDLSQIIDDGPASPVRIEKHVGANGEGVEILWEGDDKGKGKGREGGREDGVGGYEVQIANPSPQVTQSGRSLPRINSTNNPDDALRGPNARGGERTSLVNSTLLPPTLNGRIPPNPEISKFGPGLLPPSRNIGGFGLMPPPTRARTDGWGVSAFDPVPEETRPNHGRFSTAPAAPTTHVPAGEFGMVGVEEARKEVGTGGMPNLGLDSEGLNRSSSFGKTLPHIPVANAGRPSFTFEVEEDDEGSSSRGALDSTRSSNGSWQGHSGMPPVDNRLSAQFHFGTSSPGTLP